MADAREFVIYISSTVDDLKDERETALRVASEFGPVLMTRRADVVPVVDACIADVHKSDVYVGIVAMRYGWQPDQAIDPESKSITELEYDACGETIPARLVFVKDGPIRPADQDKDPRLVHRFRARVQQGGQHTAFPFDDSDIADEQKHFAFKLSQALTSARNEFRRLWSDSGGAMGGGGRPRKDLLRAVALVGIAGDDDLAIAAVKRAENANFACSTLRLDEVDWFVELDRRLRAGQSPCLLITPAGLSRLKPDKEAARIATVLKDARQCARPLSLLLAGVDPGDLPPAWADGLQVAIEAPPWTPESVASMLDALTRSLDNRTPPIDPVPDAVLAALHRQLHAAASRRSAQQKVALPILILAPDRGEIASLIAAGRPGFNGYADKDVRRLRVNEFDRMARASRRRGRDWPSDSYGDERSLWRCFGPDQPTALELVLAAIRAINEAAVGSRERRLLQRMRIVPRLYRFDDLLSPEPGRAAAVLDAAWSGALVVIDEVALLHPHLLRAARPLLDLPRTAAVAICSSDPTHSATEQLLGATSFLRVGQFLQRFETDRDPRCEVAVNSVQRLERWIRMVVPEMLALGDAGEASAELVRNSTQLLGPTGGAA